MEIDDSFPDLNSSEPIFSENEAITMDVPTIVIDSVMLYVGLCANIWMIWTLCKTWRSNSRLNFFLLPLSVADILTLSTRCGFGIGQGVTYSWRGGYYTCIFVMMFLGFAPCLAHLILTFFNLDNLITVARNKSSKIMRLAFITVSLIVSVGLVIPKGWTYTVSSWGFGREYCTIRSDNGDFPFIYERVFELLHVMIPLVIAPLFGFIALCVWCATKGKRQYVKVEGDEDDELKTAGRVVALTLAFDLFFFICWMPVIATTVVIQFNYLAVVISIYLATANSLINPFIYAVFHCINKRANKVSPGL